MRIMYHVFTIFATEKDEKMLKYISTRNKKEKVTSSEAILRGLAPDGGLYVPDNIESLKLDYKSMIKLDYMGMAETVFNKFFPEFGEHAIKKIVEKSYKGKFTDKEITPLKKVGDRYVLELYYGPTCAFKDVALSVLPNLMTKAAEINSFKDEILILTATSGDTGSAALHGFSDVEGTRIIVFFPDGKVSETQKLQMVTQAGTNTCACAIRGNFDDAQSGVKRIFREIDKPCVGVSLSSANSINIGRLVPQIVYYFAAYKQLVENKKIKEGDTVNLTVPTGNFGDIMAGYFARMMGLPVGKLICASNKNNVLEEFLKTGKYNRKRKFYKTTSPSMDILVSSNLERLLYFICGPEKTAQYMSELSEKGEYIITTDELAKIQSVFIGESCSEEEGADIIKNVFEKENYLMDTHTAVAWGSCSKAKAETQITNKCNVVLSTASPYKFTQSVIRALGKNPSESDSKNMEYLFKLTGVQIPKYLIGIFDREIKHRDVIEKEDMKKYVEKKAINFK